MLFNENEKKKLLESWTAFIKSTQEVKTNKQTPLQIQKRIAKAKKDYGFFCSYYFPHYCTNLDGEIIENAYFQNELAEKVLADRQGKFIVEWGRGLAKSTHTSLFLPLWLMAQNDKQIGFMVLVGQNLTAATTLLQGLQSELQYNKRFVQDYGEQKLTGSWESGDFTTKDNISFVARGLGQSPRGLRKGAKRPDFIVADDLDTEEMCNNPYRVEKAKQWILKALIPTMDTGNHRFILVNNRISENGILAKMHEDKQGTWHHSHVNALDKKGNPTWASKYTSSYYKMVRSDIGTNAFLGEYQNTPIEEGLIYQKEWFLERNALALNDYVAIVSYCDPSFASTAKADYKAIITLGLRKDGSVDLLDMWAKQKKTINQMVAYHYDLDDRFRKEGASISHYMEANFIQYMHIDNYKKEGAKRGWQLAIKADKNKKSSKQARVEAMSPRFENGHFFITERIKTNDKKLFIEQFLAFGNKNAYDDIPDACEGAMSMLQKQKAADFEPRFGALNIKSIRNYFTNRR